MRDSSKGTILVYTDEVRSFCKHDLYYFLSHQYQVIYAVDDQMVVNYTDANYDESVINIDKVTPQKFQNILSELSFVIIGQDLLKHCEVIFDYKEKYDYKVTSIVSSCEEESYLYEAKYISRVDAFFAKSKSIEEMLKINKVPLSKIHKISNYLCFELVDSQKTSNPDIAHYLGNYDDLILYLAHESDSQYFNHIQNALRFMRNNNPKLYKKSIILVYGPSDFENNKALDPTLADKFIFWSSTKCDVTELLDYINALYVPSCPVMKNTGVSREFLHQCMAASLAIISPRSMLIEETVGKHRFDYCRHSFRSLSRAFEKFSSNKSLVKNIAAKNKEKIEKLYSIDKLKNKVLEVLNSLKPSLNSADVKDAKSLIENADYMISRYGYQNILDLANVLFNLKSQPVSHKVELLTITAKCHINLKDYESAYKTYKYILQINPSSYKAMDGLGYLFLKEEKYDQSLVYFQKSISVNGTSEYSALGLGLVFMGFKKYEEAQKWILKSLNYNESNTVSLFTLVNISHMTHHFDTAISEIKKYTVKNPLNFDMKYTLAGLYFKKGDYSLSTDVCHDIIDKNPHDKKSHALLNKIKRRFQNNLKLG